MMPDSYRRTLTFVLLTASLAASIAYDTVLLQIYEPVQQGLAGLMALCFAAVLLLQRYPTKSLSESLTLAWPLHVYSIAFLGVCIGFHGGARLSQVVAYTYFAYVTYLLIPFILRRDQELLGVFITAVAILSAGMSIL